MTVSQESQPSDDTRLLRRPEGSIAYDVAGSGPLVVCVPGMGDLRTSYRFLAPMLLSAGFRVACTDLRGHGDSDATFADYGDEATASDVAALIRELGGPAIVVGNSMAAGSAVLVASAQPDLVRGLVLIGPFVRDPATSAFALAVFRLLMSPWWARVAWGAYLPKLYAGEKPADFADYRKAVAAALKRPGRAAALARTTRTSHVAAAAALPTVMAPTLVVMGELDPDFPDPAAEARWIAEALSGQVLLVPDAGHYPQSQRPQLTGPAIASFAKRISDPA